LAIQEEKITFAIVATKGPGWYSKPANCFGMKGTCLRLVPPIGAGFLPPSAVVWHVGMVYIWWPDAKVERTVTRVSALDGV
jgi:hypothetical protein